MTLRQRGPQPSRKNGVAKISHAYEFKERNIKIYFFKQDHTVVTMHFLLLWDGEDGGKEDDDDGKEGGGRSR